jgi:hypothetical protein
LPPLASSKISSVDEISSAHGVRSSKIMGSVAQNTISTTASSSEDSKTTSPDSKPSNTTTHPLPAVSTSWLQNPDSSSADQAGKECSQRVNKHL